MIARVLVAVMVMVVGSALVGVAVFPAPIARAHGVSDTTDVQLAQTIAGAEFTVVIRRTQDVPGPLRVDVIAHRPVRKLTVDLAVRSVADGNQANRSTATVRLERGRPGSYPAVLHVDGAGPHELELRASEERAVLPFRVLVTRAEAWEPLAYGGFAVVGVLLLTGLIGAATSKRVLAVASGGGVVIALTVAVTAALLSPRMSPTPPEGAAPVANSDPTNPSVAAGRPYAQAAIRTAPAKPMAGQEFALHLELSDGSTGRPVDDLVEHHAALAHVVITSQDGSFFRHVHPVRTAPGRLEVRLRADRAGRYLAYAEFERADSGGQLVHGEFSVAGDGTAHDTESEPTKPKTAMTITPGRPVVGRPITIDADVGSNDLQPWLGMAGHLIVRSRDGDFLGHVHELGSMSASAANGNQQPDETVASYGPNVRFTFTFPEPGRYFAWIQYERDFRIVTVPLTIEVAGEGPRP